jgi:hypothetical protein
MKKNYLLLLLLVFSMQYSIAQITTFTFESGTTTGASTFTSGTAIFNLTSSFNDFTVVNFAGTGYNASNRYIQVSDTNGQEAMGQSGFIKVATGSFRVSNLWIYLSGNAGQNPNGTLDGLAGSVTFIGKLGGDTQFTVVKTTTGANIGYAAPGNGFTQADFSTLGGSDNTNVMIDELEIKLSSNYDYFAIDNFAFEAQASAPTVTTTTATAANIGAVRATLGGNVTAGAPLLAKGIVWSTAATTTTPTLANNVVTNGSTATGAYSDFATGLTPSTLIYYRAYATNNVGTSYGAVLSFTTNAALAATQSQTDLTCNGGTNGTATVVASGGKTPYSYSWSPSGGTTATASGLAAGTYNITITDGDASTLVKTFDILQPAAAPISFTGNPPNRTVCPGNNTTFPATAINATSYQWLVNTGAGYNSITNGGVYSGATTATLTITGATASMSGYLYQLRASSLCTPGGVTSNPATLTVPSMTVSTIAKGNVQCYGDNSGSAFLSVSGGIPPYTYSWAPSGGSASSASNLAPGTYTVTVTDNIACSTTHQVVINGPTVALTATPSTTPVSCFGGSNGTASVTPVGGTTGYTYTWSTGATTQTISGRTAGTYSVTVTDGNGCELEVNNIVIGQPAAILNGTPSATPVSCFGGSNGTATIAPNGGTPGYTYAWSNGATTASITGVQAGTYSVTITDANSCQKLISDIVVGGPAAALDGTPSTTAVSCNGGSNGTATITPIGGTANYTYAWSTGATSQTITGLQAGTYSVTITDANSCQKLFSNISVSQPTVLTANPTQTNLSCFNGANGTATVTPTGGAGGYTYLWAHSGSTNASVTGLTAGTYSVKITDANACETDQSFTISEPAAIVLTPGTGNNVSCYNGSNGTATVSAAGGAGSFTYSWSPAGGTAATASGLAAGTYTVTVTDANSCQETETFTITQPAALTVSGTSQDNITCEGTPSGSASVTVNGGTGTYDYLWTPTGGTTATATGLYSGTYIVYITDANGCETSETFTITEPADPLTASSGTVANIACYGDTTGSAEVNVTGGDGNYTYSWSPSGGTGATANNLAAGTYTVTVTDGASCQKTQIFTITQPVQALSASTASSAVSCFGGSNGIASVTVSGGTFPYTYAWAPLGGTGSSISGRPAGDYTCTITDGNGCTLVKTVTISSPAAFLATTTKTDVSCSGGSNGTATVTPSGATAPYSYSWSPTGGSNASASGLSAGDYTVTVQDGNFCVYTVEITINEPDPLLLIPSQINVSCKGDSNGEASVNVTGGTPSYTYLWSPSGGTAATATGLAAGTYTVTVTDANGCTTTQSFIITQPTVLVATAAAQTNVSCNGGADASATVSVSGGTSGYSYSWAPSGGIAATATGLSAGTYIVTATDSNGCTTTQGFTITQPTAIGFTTTVLSGYDYNTGYSQSIVGSGGTGAKTYAVTTGSLPSGFSLSTAGQITGISTQIADSNFTVTATDANNCTATFNYVLKLNQIPVTVTATPSQTKVYGESDLVLTYTVSPSLLSGDSFTGSLTRVSGENIGTYAINQGSLSAGSKYLITYAGANFTITAKPITVTATTSQTKVYGTTDPVIAYTVSPSLVGSDSFTGALTRVAGENTGTYAVNQGSLSAGSNYIISYAGANFTITAKPITVTAAPLQTKVYGTTDPTFTYTVSPNLVGSDAFTGSLTRAAGENIGNYAITEGNLSAGSNYDITYVSKDFTITAKPITVTADASQTKVYGTTNPVYSYTFTPTLVSGDSFTGTLTRAAGENIGNYAITQGNLSAGANYNITYVSRDFTITAKPITVTANAAQTKVYGTTNPVYTYTVSPNLVSGDSFTGALARTAGENVGTYAITQGNLSAGANYTVTYNSSNFTITKADQVITWNQTLGFGCNGETSIVLTAVSNSGLAVNYASANANIATVSNNSLFFQNYGSTNVTASQLGNMNYNAAPAVVLPVIASQPNLIRKQFENIIFFDNSSQSFKTYSWYKNGVLVPGQTLQYFKENGVLNGTYYAVATKLDGTFITSCPLILSPTVEEEFIRVVPNPVRSNASFQLTTNISASRIQNARVEVFNLTGNLLTTVNTSQNNIDMIAPSVEGIYIVKITLANGKYFTKNLLVKN